MPVLPFKLNQDRRRHIPEQKRKVVNWRETDESLRRRGRVAVWFLGGGVGGGGGAGVVFGGGGGGVGGRAAHEPGRAARVFRPGDPDGADVQGRVPAGVPA